MHRKTIRFWLIGLVAGCVLPATLGSVLLFSISYQEQRSNFERNTIATARALVQAIDGELFGAQAVLQVLAASQHLASGDFASFYRQASEALPHLSGNYLIVTDATGQQRVNTLKPFGEGLPRQPPSQKMQRVFDSGEPAISDFVAALPTDLPGMTVEVPVISGGVVEYVLTLGVSGDRLSDILRRQSLPADWITAIFDSVGTIAARSHDAQRFVGKMGSPTFLRATADVAEGVTEANSLEDFPIQSAFSRSSRSGWGIGIGIPKSTLTGNLWRSAGIYAAVTAALLMLSLLMAKTFGTRISRSIQSLRAPALSLGSREVLSIPTTNIAEVDEVATALVSASQLIKEHELEREQSELAVRQMMVAKQSAEHASRARSEFLASMSHELRTPLHAISGFAQLLSRFGSAPRSEEQRARYTANIIEASAQLAKIIDDILELALLDTGKISVNCEVLDCLEVMTEASTVLDVLAKRRGILFSVDTSGNLPSVVADRARLLQILLSLGSNAIKYNVDDGWVLLTAIPGDGVVRFVVRDTGKGIPTERHGEVFEPFNRLGVELTQEEGSGIGLTVSRKLVEAMDGRIGFDSVVGEGSSFWVELPAASEPAAAAISSEVPITIAWSGGSTVLYIEDKMANVELMRAVIDDLNDIRLLAAYSVDEGVNVACSAMPDLVITDIHLPDGKGFDVLRRLRKDCRTSHIPVIALTADAMPANMHNMELAGFDSILTKPIKIDSLINVLRATLKAA